jgi:diguanylate cyclase (GGDEF)-like protein
MEKEADQTAGGAFLPETVLSQISSAGNLRRYAKGEVIFTQGELGSSMYVVVEGAVGLVFEHGKPGKRLEPGTFFGELALFTGQHLRTATAIAAEESRLRVLEQSAFDELLQSHPDTMALLLRQTCSYLVDSEQHLLKDLRRRNVELEQTLDYLRRMKEELDSVELLALTDELTGIYNRRCLDRQIQLLLPRAERTTEGLALVLIDIDRFKQINDTHGHHVGDLVLKRFADIIKKTVRQSDLPCRLGGDEFAVVLKELSGQGARKRAEQILKSVSAIELHLPHTTLRVSASVGGTDHRNGEDWSSFFQRADRNLYRAKGSRPHRVVWDSDN